MPMTTAHQLYDDDDRFLMTPEDRLILHALIGTYSVYGNSLDSGIHVNYPLSPPIHTASTTTRTVQIIVAAGSPILIFDPHAFWEGFIVRFGR